MSKPKYDYTAFSIKKLLEEVSLLSKIKVSNIADCEMLSMVLSRTGLQISKHTLARLYKVIRSDNIPSKYTLDQLSTFTGYHDWDNYYKKFRKENDENALFEDIRAELISENELLLLKYCIEDNAFNPVINYLNKISSSISGPFCNDSYKLANSLGFAVRDNKKAQETLIPFITKNDFTRDMFYTWWVDMDGLNRYYSDYIKNTYLKYIQPVEPNFKLNEIWAYCILMYQALYSDDKKEYSKYAYYLFNKYKAEEFILEGRSNFYPFARFHAHHIIYNELIDPNDYKRFDKKLQFLKNELPKVTDQFQIVILSHIFEALVITGRYEMIHYFTESYHSYIEKYIERYDYAFEADSIIKMVYYFQYALEKLRLKPDQTVHRVMNLPEYTPKAKVNFLNTYHFFYHSLKKMYSGSEHEKKEYLKKAVQSANKLSNKLFLKLTKDADI